MMMVMGEIYLKPPSSPDEWQAISNDFKELWNLPHCITGIDGKHVTFHAKTYTNGFVFNVFA